jgi:hypothetical protein
MRRQGVVRPDTWVQFQKHAQRRYTVGRLLFFEVGHLTVYPFSLGVVRLRRMTFQNAGWLILDL